MLSTHGDHSQAALSQETCFSCITLSLKSKFSKQAQSCFKVLLLFPAEHRSTGAEVHVKA